VRLRALDGWYVNGNRIARAFPQVILSPMAGITSATLDLTGSRLLLAGDGFTKGVLSLGEIQVHQGDQVVTLNPGTAMTNDRLSAVTQRLVTIALGPATLEALAALTGPDIYVTANTGWLKATDAKGTYKTGAVTGTDHPVYVRTTVTRAQYDRATKLLTLTGSGFTGTTVSPARLWFQSPQGVQEWRLSAEDPVVIANDLSLTIQLTDAEAEDFVVTFGGKPVYVNTEVGWLVDALGRNGELVPYNSVIFTMD